MSRRLLTLLTVRLGQLAACLLVAASVYAANPVAPWGAAPWTGANPYFGPWGGGYPAQGYPGMPGGQQFPQAAQAARPPQVELALSDTAPFVQQSLVMNVWVISGSSLSSANVEVPVSADFIIRSLEDRPTTSSRSNEGRQEIVTEYRYLVVPLRAGSFLLPRVRVTGTLSNNQRFEAESARPLRVHVQAPAEGVQPWLPLQRLSLRGWLQGVEQAQVGMPVYLTVELSATGTTGAQLPSIEAQLRSEDFRVYREKTHTEGQVTEDGSQLEGRRVENYTLVPLHGGKLQVPGIRIPWFDLGLHRTETASLPIKQVAVSGSAGGSGLSSEAEGSFLSGLSPALVWIPLGVVLLALAGYWFMALKPGAVETPAAPTLTADNKSGWQDALRMRAHNWLGRLSPVRLAALARARFVASLPPRLRLWFCLRVVEQEQDPENWADAFRWVTAKHLATPPQPSLPRLGEHIINLGIAADPAALRRLMAEMEQALYGGPAITDFPAWKRALKHAIRPRLSTLRRNRGRRRLPDLNPRTT